MKIPGVETGRVLCVAGCALFLIAPGSPLPGQGPAATIGPGPFAAIMPPPPNYRYPDGQSYVYGVEWHLFNAGTAKVGLQSDGGQQHVVATAVSAGVVNALYKVNDRFEAFFDTHKFCS